MSPTSSDKHTDRQKDRQSGFIVYGQLIVRVVFLSQSRGKILVKMVHSVRSPYDSELVDNGHVSLPTPLHMLSLNNIN